MATFPMYHAESLCILAAAHHTAARLEAIGTDLYYIHNCGVAIIDLRWIRSMRGDSIANLHFLTSEVLSHYHHMIVSSSPFLHVVGAGILRHSTFNSATVLCA